MFIPILEHVFLALCLCFIYFNYFYSSNSNFSKGKVTYDNLPRKFHPERKENFFSSVFCRGTNHTDRLCHFKNLCYDPKSKLYIFFHDHKSMTTGLPLDRFAPTLVDFSSVFDHNTLYFNYIEVPSNYFSEFNFSYLTGNFLLLKRFNPDNLMHVFHDDLLPIFTSLNELSLHDFSLVFADNRPPGPYAVLYENFLFFKPLYISMFPIDKLQCFENAYIGLSKHSTWYQYGFKYPQGPLIKNMNDLSSVVLNFRDYFIKKFSLKQPTFQKKAVILVRKQNRKILNLDKVDSELSRSTKLQTSRVSLEELSVLQVIQEIMCAKVLVGMHGSLLVLSMFLPPSSIVLELFPYGIDSTISTPYKTLVEIPGLNLIYKSLTTKEESNCISHPDYPRELGGIRHLSVEEQKHIQNSAVKPFLCCEDPTWLYRIYQDTVVDIPSFHTILDEALQLNQLKSSNELQLYPGEVQNLVCEADKAIVTDWVCEWDQPWNMKFLKPLTLEYEVWIQDTSTEDVRAFLMRRKAYRFSVKPKSVIYVWVRCHLDGRTGPFNSSPFVCS